MSKIGKDKQLTLEVLKRNVPLLHAGEAAQEKLQNDPPTDITEAQALQRTVIAGEQAKERLITSSLSFVTMLAKKEMSRRSQWGSSVPLDDIIQEGFAGLLKGLRAYDPTADHKSPTNYLGQWVSTQMRRGLENMDHSFSVPQEAIERHRKIRAIRSRLETEMGRRPTDQEIVDAARDSKGQYGDTKMGRLNKTQNSTAPRTRDITLAHVEEERKFSSRTGALLPTEKQSSGEYEMLDIIDISSSASLSRESGDRSAEDVDEQSGKHSLTTLLETTITRINMPEQQQTIIRMKYGLPPYDTEHTVKSIVSGTKIPKHRIKQVIDAFSEELTTKQSVFHYEATKIADDLHAIGIGWVGTALGVYDETKPMKRVNSILNTPLKPTEPRRTPSMPSGVLSRVKNRENRHVYVCPVHGEFIIHIETEPSPTNICNINDCVRVAHLLEGS